ncbi:MAG TPA: group 1 truncated hemoglobin [Pyrinomonadaceae bacterium]|nr:group 1 truncated hemoglobin [Pyrinomonadaceae bacterium]
MKKSFHRSPWLVVALLLLIGCGWEARAQEAAHQETSAAQSLYKRLGGYDALAAVTDDFVKRLVEDKQLTRFFNGVSTDSRKRIRQLVLDQLCAATGGPCIYIGRSMRTVHEGLGITEDDWNTAVKLLGMTLEKFKVPKVEQGELATLLGGLKADIVDKK